MLRTTTPFADDHAAARSADQPISKPNSAPIRVRVLTPMLVAGKEVASGALATMSLSDAQLLRSAGRVEFLEP